MKSGLRKGLVLTTLLCLALLSMAVVKHNQQTLPPSITLDVTGQPTIGYPKALVQVVVFEEPKCPECKNYNNLIFPLIKKEFINTNKILYTVIPVSFLPHSMPAAIALMCVYHQDADYPNKDLFFKYLDYMYLNQPSEKEDWAKDELLTKWAHDASPAIDLSGLKSCVDREGHRIQIEKNTKYGSQVMEGELSTPAIYVNGMRADDISYSSLSKLIKSALRDKGSGE